jgi:tRNA(Phe) wybutosine-synthesizing methylase Tyw3
MIDALKEKLVSKGAELMQHPAFTKLMESEKMGILLEKALSVPIKVSGAMQTHKERMTALFELASRQDVDELKRSISRLEDLLGDLRRESETLLRETDRDDGPAGPVAK